MKRLIIIMMLLITSITYAYITSDSNDPNIRAKCRDGTYSTSVGRGTCSHHGGVQNYLTNREQPKKRVNETIKEKEKKSSQPQKQNHR